ncbi:GET complex subunit GET1 ASCRUDRAFT_155304 [Ascoidea rubescens DSM 1968]|uniref:Guided entry of tail-anchored proteins 1 n=1 Tax=Ascoidea rubescens DSM 1968 TaxID=1344418 RepID=A0A1D2VGB4_9ASCO|nr:hypothetical protein ASCRUDRAFT_155304 [Ascoidea rubescens DSM 1968]ODV60580.1 hypothetical protein ASCRUDRAFT_155304 [Ascoidea rubescens DSM 1968]
MFDALLFIFFWLLLKHTIKLIGSDNVSSFLNYYYLLIFRKNADFNELHSMRANLKHIHHEKLKISAQDQYAKWTKLDRNFNKMKTDINNLEKKLITQNEKTIKRFNSIISWSIAIPLWYLRWFYSNDNLYWLPNGIFPKPIEFWLALPRNPYGSISLACWIFLIGNFMNTLESILFNLFLAKKVENPALNPKISPLTENENSHEKTH